MIKKNQKISFDSLIEGIQDGDQKAQRLLFLFLKEETYPKVERFLLNRGSQQADAEDWFQEAILVLINAIKTGKFSFSSLSFKSQGGQLGAYVMSVVKNLWKKEIRRINRDAPPKDDLQESNFKLDFSAALIQEEYNKLGSQCQHILTLHFVQKMSPRVMAGILQQTTENTKKQLQTCTENLVKNIGQVLQESHKLEMATLLNNGLNQLEARCHQLLTGFYYDKKSMTELAKEMGFANRRVVTEQKHRCMKKLNSAIVSTLFSDK